MISKIILGTAQFGLNYGINNTNGKPSQENVMEMLDYAYDQGINILDTADAYGNAAEILGKYNVKNHQKFEINTKFKDDRSSLAKQLNSSLYRLNIDSVNVYFYHSFNDFIDFPDKKIQLLDLKKKGKIKKIGLSVYGNDEFQKACESDLIDVIQFPFNLLDNISQRGDQIKLAKIMGKELQARSGFLQGLFFKPLANLPSKLKPLLRYLERIHEIAESANFSTEQLALSYVLQQSEIDNCIIGVDSIQQLVNNIEMSKNIITNNTLDAINQINVKEVGLLYPKNW